MRSSVVNCTTASKTVWRELQPDSRALSQVWKVRGDVHQEAGASAALTLLSSRSRTRRRVSRPGHENRGRWTAASHAGRNQPEVHAQPGKKLVPQQELVVSPQGMRRINPNHSRLLRVHLTLPSLFCPSLIFASSPFISSLLPLLPLREISDDTLDVFGDTRPLRFVSLRGRLAVSAFAILDLLLRLSVCVF